jgi:hypothetical protein
MFHFTGHDMWPLCYSIMTLPPSVRDKPHVGKCHVILRHITSNYVMSYYVILRQIMSCQITSYYVKLCHVKLRHITSNYAHSIIPAYFYIHT